MQIVFSQRMESQAGEYTVTVECCNITAENTKRIELCEHDRTVTQNVAVHKLLKYVGSVSENAAEFVPEISGVERSGFVRDSK